MHSEGDTLNISLPEGATNDTSQNTLLPEGDLNEDTLGDLNDKTLTLSQ